MIGLGVFVAGAGGAVSRYLLESAITCRAGHRFPYGTLTVNLLGSLALGLVTGAAERDAIGTDASTIVAIGFLGAFTTFSAFAIEADRLPAARRLAYVAASVVGGLALAAAGLALALALL